MAKLIDPFKGYIFDCDGTLAASMGLHHQAWEFAVINQIGEWSFPWDFFCSIGGMTTFETVELLRKRYGFNLNVAQIKKDTDSYLDANLEQVKPIENVIKFAKNCVANGFPIAVASGGYKRHVHRILKNIKVDNIFDVVVTVEDVKKSKPAPDLFLLAAKKINIPPKDCLVIEDSPKGFDAAEAAGMMCLMVHPY